MKTTSTDVADVSWLNGFEVGERRARVPDGRSDRAHKGGPSDGPQGMSIVMFRHFPYNAG